MTYIYGYKVEEMTDRNLPEKADVTHHSLVRIFPKNVARARASC